MELKNKVPGLFAFNRMAVARKGNVPCNVIVLTGSGNDIKAVADYEAKFLFEKGITINETIITDNKDGNIPQSYLLEDTVGVTIDPGNIYFVKKNSAGIRSNTFDVAGLGGPSYEELAAKFAEKLGFDNVDDVTKYIVILCNGPHIDMQKVIEIMSSDDSDIIETILNNHFMKYEDNVCHDSDELIPFSAAIANNSGERKNTRVIRESIPENVKVVRKEHEDPKNLTSSDTARLNEIKEIDRQIEAEVKNNSERKNKSGLPSFIANAAAGTDNGSKHNEAKVETKPEAKVDVKNDAPAKNEAAVKHGGAADKLAGFAKKRDNEVKQKRAEDEENEATNFAPKPVEKKEKKHTGNVKTTLTKAEDEKNKQLLAELTSLYEETMQFIDDTCNSQFRVIRNKMEEALKNKKFRQQYSTMYLDITDDVSTELYKRLYNLDLSTAKFYKELTAQVVEMGCAFCGKSWREDITFMEPGPHYIECPHCAGERGFEKEAITE